MTGLSQRTAGLLAVGIGIAACGEAPTEPTPPQPAPYVSKAATETVAEPPPALRYVDVTSAAGVDFVHETGAYGEKLLPETTGSGAAFLDHDGDGDSDLLLLNGDWWPGHEKEGPRPTWRFYRNDGDWAFTDVTEAVGLAVTFYAMGATACDTDGDGDTDLFVSGVGGYRFFRNDGGRFVDGTADSGLDPGTWTDAEGGEHGPFATSAAFFDYDKDGRPDLFVGHYVHWSVETDVWSTMDGETKSYAVPAQYQGESCRLWRNLGGNRFEDVTDAAGVRNDEGKTLGVAVLDFDRDGWTDVAVANDTQPDYLYRNRGDGTFEDVALRQGMAFRPDGKAGAGMGIDAACLEGAESSYIAVGNFSREAVALWERRGRIFINRSDRSGVAKATLFPLTFAVRFLDADLDGRQDLALVNGHIEPTVGEVEQEVTYEQPMQLLRGGAGLRFEDISAHLGPDFVKPVVGRGLATADVDGDGDLDLLVTVNRGRTRLLRADLENAAARSLRITVKGKAPATDALGAKVTVTSGDRTQAQWVRTGGGFLCQGELTLTFGLGDAGSASRVLVEWPDGTSRDLADLAAGHHVIEP